MKPKARLITLNNYKKSDVRNDKASMEALKQGFTVLSVVGTDEVLFIKGDQGENLIKMFELI
jgi:hypothetical protein